MHIVLNISFLKKNMKKMPAFTFSLCFFQELFSLFVHKRIYTKIYIYQYIYKINNILQAFFFFYYYFSNGELSPRNNQEEITRPLWDRTLPSITTELCSKNFF